MEVQFDEHMPLGYGYKAPPKGGITYLIIRMGLAKDEAGSKKVMLVITILCFILSFYFFYKALA